jgi:hypothetical protein
MLHEESMAKGDRLDAAAKAPFKLRDIVTALCQHMAKALYQLEHVSDVVGLHAQ